MFCSEMREEEFDGGARSWRGFAPEPSFVTTADFDWREKGDEKWHMTRTLADGHSARPFKGGAALSVDGKTVAETPNEEYQRIHRRFAELLETRRGDVNPVPLRIVADAMLLRRRLTTDAFNW